MTADPTIAEELPRRCGDCGYDLRGLPDQGRCAECGVTYVPDVIVLFGWACGKSATARNARGGRAAWAIVSGVLWLLLQMSNALIGIGRQPAFFRVVLVILCLTAAGAVYQLILRRDAIEAAGGGRQLRLSAEGYGSRDGVGPVTFQPWTPAVNARLFRAEPGRWRLVVTKKVSWWTFKPRNPDWETDFEWDTSDAYAEVVRTALCHWARSRGAAMT